MFAGAPEQLGVQGRRSPLSETLHPWVRQGHALYDAHYQDSWSWLDDPSTINGMSVTFCELQQAWFQRPDDPVHGLVYVRSPRFLRDVDPDDLDVFTTDFSKDSYAKQMIEEM